MAKIGVFDSGVGGLSVLRELLKALPGEDFVYYADTAYCPYGGRSREYVIERACAVTETLLSEGCELIVVACNTATSAAISCLRERYPVPFVGMEPAVKPAALETRSGVVGVLATAGTLKGSKYLDMKDRYADGITVVEHTGSGFVEAVEKMAASERGLSVEERDEVQDTVRRSLRPLVDAGADTIVLGCTHYPFLLPQLETAATELCPGRHISFIDPAPAIARRVTDVLKELGQARCPSVRGSNPIASSDKKPELKLMSSGSYDNLVRAFERLCR